MKTRHLLLALLTCLASINVSAEIGTWTDENGTTWTFEYDSNSMLNKTVSLCNYKYDPVTGSYSTQTPCISGTIPTELVIPNTVYVNDVAYAITQISKYAFIDCSNLTSITIPEGVTIIDWYAFRDCSSLTSITIQEGVTNIGLAAFLNCSSLTSITIPDGVTSIADYAFQNCSSLTSITIPEGVTSIGSYAFRGCNSLTTIKLEMRTPIEIDWENFQSVDYENTTLYVPKGSKAAYEAADVWKDFGAIVEYDYVDVDQPSIAVGGSTTIEIGLNNFDSDLVAFQMDLNLPEGVSLDKTGCSLSSRITDEEQELIIGQQENGAYRLTSSSLSLTPISGTEGTLLTLKLTATEDCDDAQATISNIRFSTAGSKRINMPDETFDIDILHKFKLTYMLDGEVYKADDIVETTPLVLEAEPTKDGYTFGGWSELPETMPGNDVEITGRFYLYGDVNTDEEVDVVDVVDIARFVVATPSAKFREKLADLNSDNSVDLGDAVVLVNHIAGDVNFAKAMYAHNSLKEGSETLSLTKNGKTLALSLTSGRAYTAFQFDLYVAEDATVNQITINTLRKQEHLLFYNKVEDGHYRVAVLSTSNGTFNGNEGELLSFVMDDEPDTGTEISNIQFFDTKGKAYAFDAIGIGLETDIQSMTDAAPEAQDVEDGKYIENGRVVIYHSGRKYSATGVLLK